MPYDPTQLESYKTSDPLFHATVSYNPSGGLAGYLQATGKYPSYEGLQAASQQAGLGNYFDHFGGNGSSKLKASWSALDAQIIQALQQKAIEQKNAGTTFGQVPISAEDQAAAARSGKAETVANGYDMNGPGINKTAPPNPNPPVNSTPAEPLQAQTQALNTPLQTQNPNGIATPPTSSPNITPQINSLNQGATPTTNNGVSNSTSGSQYTPGQVAAGFGNISNPLIPQEQQRKALDPNNITGYQDLSKVA